MRSLLRQEIQIYDKTRFYDYNNHYDERFFCAWIESSEVVNYLFSLLRSPTGPKQEVCRKIIANQDYLTLTDSNYSKITQKNHLKEIRAQLRTGQQNAGSNVPFEGDVCSVERLLTMSKPVSNLTGLEQVGPVHQHGPSSKVFLPIILSSLPNIQLHPCVPAHIILSVNPFQSADHHQQRA